MSTKLTLQANPVHWVHVALSKHGFAGCLGLGGNSFYTCVTNDLEGVKCRAVGQDQEGGAWGSSQE